MSSLSPRRLAWLILTLAIIAMPAIVAVLTAAPGGGCGTACM